MWHAAQIILNESVVNAVRAAIFCALPLIIRCVYSIIIEFWYDLEIRCKNDSSTKLDQHDLILYSLKSMSIMHSFVDWLNPNFLVARLFVCYSKFVVSKSGWSNNAFQHDTNGFIFKFIFIFDSVKSGQLFISVSSFS